MNGQGVSRGLTVGRVVLGLVLVGWSIPFAGALLASVQPRGVVQDRGWWSMFTDPGATLAHYRFVLRGGAGGGLWDSFLDTIAIATPATIVVIVVAAAIAYVLAWTNFRGRTACYLGIVALAVVPVQVALVPLVSAYGDLGFDGSWLGLWLAHAAFGLPLMVLLLRNAFGAVPGHLVDAARADGAGHLATWSRVVVPLSIPGLAAATTLQFLLIWNDFLVAGTLLGGPDSGRAPLALGLAELVQTHGQDQHLLGAAVMVTIALPLVVFFGLQRLVVSGAAAATFDT